MIIKQYVSRFLSIKLFYIVSNYGAIIAMFLMPAIATGSDKIELTVIVVASIATAATIPFLFFPSQPPTPASHPASNAENEFGTSKPELTLRQGTMLLLKNPHFLILLIIHSLNVGLSIAWNGLMNQAISPYGYSDNEIGNIAAIGVVGGTLGCRKCIVKYSACIEILCHLHFSHVGANN